MRDYGHEDCSRPRARRERAWGKTNEVAFGRRHRRLLERQLINEHVLKGMRLRWELEQAEDRARESGKEA